MTRTIKASEIKPGMTVKFDLDGWRVDGTVSRVEPVTFGVDFYSTQGLEMTLGEDAPVTVLAEPAPAQPEEPRWIAARAKVGDRRFFTVDESDRPWRKADCMGHIFPYRYSWSDVCSLGQVTVIPDQGWTVPADSPEVPERIEEWDTWDDVPEGVVVTVPGLFCHYRKNQGAVEFSDPDDDPDWTEPGVRTMPRDYGPWTRVTDDAPEVPERIEEWPEWDKHLRAYEWRDQDGRPWIYSRTHGRWYNFSRTAISKLVTDEPKFGPWTRVSDA